MKKNWGKKNLAKKTALVAMFSVIVGCMTACVTESDASYAEAPMQSNGYYEETYDGAMNLVGGDAGSSYETMDMVTEDAMEMETTVESGTEIGTDVTTNRKLIRTVSMDVETEDFDSMVGNVESRVENLGGYIESAYTYNGSAYSLGRNRYAEMTVRVPDNKLESFVEEVAGFSNVVSKTTTTEDITLQYVDTEGLRDMYLAEETSLLALLEKAETVEDITYLTMRLSEVRYNIENLESRLLKYDDLVEYATIHLYIEEVEVFTPVETEEKTLWEEISEGFMASVKDIWNSFVRFCKNLIIALPYIIRFFVIVGLIVLAIRIIIAIMKKAIRKKKAKKAAQSGNALEAKKQTSENVEQQTAEITAEHSDTAK